MNRVLIPLFVTAYFKKYANTFFILFGLLVSYFLFIQTAGDFFEHSQEYWSFLIPIQVVQEPISLALFFLISLLYAYSCMRFVRQQLYEDSTNFLQLSLKGLGIKEEFRIWLIVYSLLFSPLITYGLFVIVIGFLLGEAPFMYFILGIILLPLPISAYYTARLYCFKHRDRRLFLSFRYKGWWNSLLGIKLAYHLQYNKLLIGLTKGFGLVLIYLFLYPFDVRGWDIRTVYLLAMCIALLHTVLLYKEFIYEAVYMTFTLNFPYRMIQRYGHRVWYFLILCILELSFVCYLTNIQYALLFLVFLLANILFLNSLILSIGNQALLLVKILTLYFFICILLILYHILWVLMAAILILSILLFFKHYHLVKYKL
ncbi:hypothetical protein LZQ00_05710 [Sphingobacterium sp. SRCM116780]|uniref:hypothetical protein n=1 Tax=Sphingobacterium sp. SRCM116780 TaxID=2907623 RepID=UPI001F35B7D5|nr:hypothetical protein [Sphingobacterium sp. SRCM116780]UIR57310.1 hypothetical protein LZQ00_05710 [Sphingobacterium sp. SRCM116780]